MLLIFLVVNAMSVLLIRYTKNVYESSSEIKLDIKTDASEFGITNVIEEQENNIVAGEIEVIKSKLFLNRVLDESDFDVSFISTGRFLNNEMFRNAPARVIVGNRNHSLYNMPIYFEEINDARYELTVGEKTHEGIYGQPIEVAGLQLTLVRNNVFQKGDELGYYFVINSRELLLNYLSMNLTVEPLNFNAKTIRISFKDYNQFKAQSVLNKIDTVYLQYSNEQKSLANKQKIQWLANELSQIEKRMESYENYFEEFTLKNRSNDVDQSLEQTISAINALDSQRYQLLRKTREVERFIAAVRQGEDPVLPENKDYPASLLRDLDALLQKQLELEKMKLSYQETSFTFKQQQNEITLIQKQVLDRLSQMKTEWEATLKSLDKRKQVLEEAFADFPNKNTEFTKNQRFYKLYEEFYLSLMQSKSQFEIAQAGTTPDFKILSPATFPNNPISPNRPMIAGIGFVASIVFNFFFIGILYLLNNKITSISDLEKIPNVSVMGAIPVSKQPTEAVLHIVDYPKSIVSEAIRSLRTNLDFFNAASPQKIVAISSTVSGEGKSFLAMNLGAVLALSNKRVVLVDLDMRKPKINQLVADRMDNTKGVSTVLIKKNAWTECVQRTALPNFDFIPAGPHPPNPSELLVNGQFSQLLQELKSNYDFIIMDTPPVGLVTDGIMAMRQADVSLYVFRANYSKKEFLYNLKRIIQLNKFSNVTTVLNAVHSRGKTYGYDYYVETSVKSSSSAT